MSQTAEVCTQDGQEGRDPLGVWGEAFQRKWSHSLTFERGYYEEALQ